MIASSPFQNTMPYEYRPYDSEPITTETGWDGMEVACALVTGVSGLYLCKTLHDTFKRR
jgi:hypothetical protein